MEVTWVQDRTASDVALILKLVNCRNMVGSSLLGLHHMNNSSRGSFFYFLFFCHSSLHWSLTKQHGFLDESSRVSIRAQIANCVNESEEKEP